MCPHSLSVFCCNPSDKNWAKSESRSLQKADICDYIISPLGIYPKKLILRSTRFTKNNYTPKYLPLIVLIEGRGEGDDRG